MTATRVRRAGRSDRRRRHRRRESPRQRFRREFHRFRRWTESALRQDSSTPAPATGEPAAAHQTLGVSDGAGADAITCTCGMSVLISATCVGVADALTVGCSVRITFGPSGAFFGLTASS